MPPVKPRVGPSYVAISGFLCISTPAKVDILCLVLGIALDSPAISIPLQSSHDSFKGRDVFNEHSHGYNDYMCQGLSVVYSICLIRIGQYPCSIRYVRLRREGIGSRQQSKIEYGIRS